MKKFGNVRYISLGGGGHFWRVTLHGFTSQEMEMSTRFFFLKKTHVFSLRKYIIYDKADIKYIVA